ncbi:hypothetical protein GJ744_000773 [Endocarpon pusillum]|uniref:Uncharacterized protein n=1 Tax=Endocarpon pusillum TaxID=364733 RepID=A0A8H7AE54_9EURO|nr:hypothetical protein GJ744_000773 [Endocarpon pusillum]
MPSDKARLYVALYVRGGGPKMPGQEDNYHWAFLVAPKNENKDSTGTRYHAKNAPGQSTWVFEEKSTSMTATNMILVRVMIGKVNDPQALAAKLRQGVLVVRMEDEAIQSAYSVGGGKSIKKIFKYKFELLRRILGSSSLPSSTPSSLYPLPILVPVPFINDEPGWNCVTWLQSALALIAQDTSVMETSTLNWETAKAAAMQYCEKKTGQGRFSGEGDFDTSKVPTFDLLQGKETIK